MTGNIPSKMKDKSIGVYGSCSTNTYLLNNVLKIYKEYEFIYLDNETREHGIIDLLLIYNDHATIVDYKLKNTQDEAYKKQLAGYKKYIEELTGLKTLTYLYSLMNAELIEI